ncbi:MAG: HAMP domain-containing histidine kinase [Clostridia bacterium]|jgi:two-component system sensor histidine kinase CiaH|nr:HAMP domain-containing histidine kinase [Clostridia bacterium]
MIKKLNQRIFLVIMVSLSIIILGTIILFTVLNYSNTINTATFMMDRFMGEEMKKGPDERADDYKIKPETTIDGVYNFLVQDYIIVQSSNLSNDKAINDYVIKIAKKNTEKGIIGKYIYKVRKTNPNTVRITFVENENTISHIKMIFIFSIIIAITSLLAIYKLAKKVSKMIVKPVEETFEKQKQFISDASHELKTPLAVIEANSDVLENEIGKNKWINYIQNETESMNKLINELLLLAKIENVDNVKEYEQLNLSKEVEIILSMFESMAYEKQVNITSKISENITMNGNKEDIEHIVSTLTDNAIKHTKAPKEVEVELKKEKNEIILEVKNMGDPIPEKEREKIFERFYRIDKSRNRNEKRYGLGLAIAKSTVEKYNGKIEVFYKDNFTVFKVTIPN